MKWEKKVDDLLIRKHRREFVEVPTNLLRKAKTEKQMLVRNCKDILLTYSTETQILKMFIDSVEEMCVNTQNGKEKETIKQIRKELKSFKENYFALVGTVQENILESMKEDSDE